MVWRGHYPDLLKTLQDKLSFTGTYSAPLTNGREDSKLMRHNIPIQNLMRILIVLLLLGEAIGPACIDILNWSAI